MKIAVAAFTRQGAALCKKVCRALGGEKISCRGFAPLKYADGLAALSPSLREWSKEAFYTYDGIVFIAACGIAVRAVAPYIQNKTSDPAVVVLDEGGNFAVALLSGHIGGANALARKVAHAAGAQPVITTATDIRGVFAADEWAERNNMAVVNPGKIKTVSAALLEGEKVGFASAFPLKGPLPAGFLSGCGSKVGIFVSLANREPPFQETLHLAPRILHVGLGCRRGTGKEEIEAAVLAALEKCGYPAGALAGVASIALKKKEEGILLFAEKYSLPLKFFPAKTLLGLPGVFSESAYVRQVTGVGCVCERAACASAGQGRLLAGKTVFGPVTVAFAAEEWGIRFEY